MPATSFRDESARAAALVGTAPPPNGTTSSLANGETAEIAPATSGQRFHVHGAALSASASTTLVLESWDGETATDLLTIAAGTTPTVLPLAVPGYCKTGVGEALRIRNSGGASAAVTFTVFGFRG